MQLEAELVTEDYFAEKLRESGSVPCKLHGMDHLSRDPECEFCKKALGPMYRHLNHKYGMQIADHTPTLSFRFFWPITYCGNWCQDLNGFCVAITRYSPVMGLCSSP